MKNSILKALFMGFLFGIYLPAEGNSISLNGGWDLHFWKQPETPVRSPEAMRSVKYQTIPATVPGNVELDLMAAGLVRDPLTGANVWDMRLYEDFQWCFVRRFPTPELRQDQKIVLWFGGLDCFADIWLNGKQVGSTDNMLIEHAFDITGLLEKGKDNELYVIIRSAVLEAQNYLLSTLAVKWGSANEESVHVRKAPHMYGWDIMPRLISAGLWRNVELRIADPVRFVDVHWMTERTDAVRRRADVIVDYQLKIPFDNISNCYAVVSLKKGGKEVFRKSSRVLSFASRISFSLNDADLWWPRGYGDPALYEAELLIVGENGDTLASDRKNIGLRTVRLDYTEITTPENPGEFVFSVNGEKIFIKGTNWVPLDALHSRDVSFVEEVIGMAVDLNCNMLRCWGGNVYEDHLFFDLCDKNGILVWQDFAMACNVAPQTDDFAERITKEVTSVVLKLRNHPSIILWCGNNENDQFLPFLLDPNKERISRRVIPEILFELDPMRPYLPSSPYYTQAFHDAGGRSGRQWHLLSQTHLWGHRGYYKDPNYTSTNAHFVSEIGNNGCPNRESLERMFDRDSVYPWKKGTFEWNEQWLIKATRMSQFSHRQDEFNNILVNNIKSLFGEVPTDLNTFIFASQSVQAEAKKFWIEFWRSAKFRRTGIIWWNLRCGWPVVSADIVDYYGGKKLAYYYIKQVQYDACVMVVDDNENNNHPIVAVNDTRTEKQGTVVVKDIDTQKELFSGKFTIPVNGKTIVGHIPQTDKQAMWLIEYTIDNVKFTNHYLAGKPPFNLKDYEKWHKKLGIRN